MIPFKTVFEEDMKDPEFVKEYEALREEFDLAEELIKARKAVKMTQKQVAERMGTSQSQITRLESGKGTISSLRRYANVTGKKVKITLV